MQILISICKMLTSHSQMLPRIITRAVSLRANIISHSLINVSIVQCIVCQSVRNVLHALAITLPGAIITQLSLSLTLNFLVQNFLPLKLSFTWQMVGSMRKVFTRKLHALTYNFPMRTCLHKGNTRILHILICQTTSAVRKMEPLNCLTTQNTFHNQKVMPKLRRIWQNRSAVLYRHRRYGFHFAKLMSLHAWLENTRQID